MMQHEYKVIDIDLLKLRPDNPRNVVLDPLGDESDAMNHLIDVVGKEKLKSLARDIAEKGTLNPADPVMVTQVDNYFMVLEGNRRIAAIKLMMYPQLVHDLKTRTELEKIASSGTVPQQVNCVVFPDEESSRSWISLKHTGENNGVGTVRWGALQVQRFSGKESTQSSKAMALVDIVLEEFPEDSSLRANLSNVLNEKSTNLGRLISTPEVRKAMGILQTDQGFAIKDRNLLHQTIKLIATDFLKDIGVSNIHSKADRINYIDDVLLRSGLTGKNPSVMDNDPDIELDNADDNGEDPRLDAEKEDAPAREMPAPISEESRLFESLEVANLEPNIRKLIRSAQKLRFNQDPLAIGVLTRAITEFTLDQAYRQLPVPKADPDHDNLDTKLNKVLKYLDPDVGTRERAKTHLGVLYRQANQSHIVTDLHGFVHWLDVSAAPANMRHLSRILRPLLMEIDTRIGAIGTTSNNTP